MNYIVFDLEWNQCPYGKGQENERISDTLKILTTGGEEDE